MDTSFVEELASAAPTPGGGGASAYCGALASALASMVGNLTVGKKSFAQVEPEVYMRLEKLAALRRRLLELVGEDAQAFGPLAAAYRMPKDTPEQQAAKEAAIQLRWWARARCRLTSCARLRPWWTAPSSGVQRSRMARSDAGVAAAFARAAVDGASLNVYINVASMADDARAEGYRKERIAWSRRRASVRRGVRVVKDAIS